MQQNSIINSVLINLNRCIQIHGPEYTNLLLKNASQGIVAHPDMVETIINKTCYIFGLPRIKLITSNNAAPLYVCMYLIKKETGLRHREIAKLFDRAPNVPSNAIKYINSLNPGHPADIPVYLKLQRLMEEINQHKNQK